MVNHLAQPAAGYRARPNSRSRPAHGIPAVSQRIPYRQAGKTAILKLPLMVLPTLAWSGFRVG